MMYLQQQQTTTVTLLLTLLLTTTVTTTLAQNSTTCKTVTTVEDFDIDQYASAPWYSHQQAVNSYSPIEQNYCTTAQYTVLDEATFWGYTVGVKNTAKYDSGAEVGGDLCAYQTGDEDDIDYTGSKLAVAPCFLPKVFAGPYWVVAYDEVEGYALISGGQPTVPTEGGLCKTGTGINDSGLWIFSRSQERNETLIEKVRSIATDAGFDTSVLNDVDHTGCDVCEDTDDVFEVGFFFKRERDCDWVADWTSFRCIGNGDKCPETCGLC